MSLNYTIHECPTDIDPTKDFDRYTIRLIHDEKDHDAALIHYWSLFNGEYDHPIQYCPYCSQKLE